MSAISWQICFWKVSVGPLVSAWWELQLSSAVSFCFAKFPNLWCACPRRWSWLNQACNAAGTASVRAASPDWSYSEPTVCFSLKRQPLSSCPACRGDAPHLWCWCLRRSAAGTRQRGNTSDPGSTQSELMLLCEPAAGTCPAVVYRCSWAELSSEQMNCSWFSFSLACSRSRAVSFSLKQRTSGLRFSFMASPSCSAHKLSCFRDAFVLSSSLLLLLSQVQTALIQPAFTVCKQLHHLHSTHV